MNLANDFDRYKEEIELILTQNAVEVELYSIIACVIRERANSNNISLRDVSTRRGTDLSKIFKSESGFPDFVILTKKFDKYKPDKKEIKGAIEVKSVSKKISECSNQLEMHIKYFENVIYTNGLEWQFYNSESIKNGKSAEWTIELGGIKGEKINWHNNDINWKKLLEKLEEIKWI